MTTAWAGASEEGPWTKELRGFYIFTVWVRHILGLPSSCCVSKCPITWLGHRCPCPLFKGSGPGHSLLPWDLLTQAQPAAAPWATCTTGIAQHNFLNISLSTVQSIGSNWLDHISMHFYQRKKWLNFHLFCPSSPIRLHKWLRQNKYTRFKSLLSKNFSWFVFWIKHSNDLSKQIFDQKADHYLPPPFQNKNHT